MVSDQDRIILIKYRIQQAHETVDLAEFLLTYNKTVVCVNRVYYGMFYALTALALKHQFETSKHSQFIGWFNKKFVYTIENMD